MASDRAKLVLDEQSFQGLLAAAFTIQQHNARMNSADPPPGETAAPAQAKTAPPETQANPPEVRAAQPNVCNQCGASLPAAGAPCPSCASSFRPGERLQRNWASLWQMSQEQGLPLDARRKPVDDLPLSPADPGRPRPSTAGLSPVEHPSAASAAPTPPLRIQETHEDTAPANVPAHSVSDSRNGDREWVRSRIEWPAETEPEQPALADSPDSPTLDQRDLEGDEAWGQPDTAADPNRQGISSLRVKLHFHRADLFLGLAVIVAAAALLWPAGGGQKASLPVWERMLIAMGVAEAPQPAVHSHGDPDLKVWVDKHTALYYCPGDELYGKSPDGHYTTQREAQADRFEPAERSVCIQ